MVAMGSQSINDCTVINACRQSGAAGGNCLTYLRGQHPLLLAPPEAPLVEAIDRRRCSARAGSTRCSGRGRRWYSRPGLGLWLGSVELIAEFAERRVRIVNLDTDSMGRSL
jgi:hypothetical protein